MLFGIGCDIEEISRFNKLVAMDEFVDLVFLPLEKEYCRNKQVPEQHFAVRFCGKEAVIKALASVNIGKVDFLDIEIINDGKGVPRVRISKNIRQNIDIKLSLSHSRNSALAQALVIIN